jgi:DNA-binding response OmpR family regulator
MSTVLVVEDDEVLLETLVYNLKDQGYIVEVADDGIAALEAAHHLLPDLILLDLMLPKLDGFEVCRILRQEMNIPILMLTARDREADRVNGLEIGADDYITKPFSMRELMARVKAHLRRQRLIRADVTAKQGDPHQGVLQFGNLVLDLARREARLDGKSLRFTPKEYELMLFLAQHPSQTLSRQLLLSRLWTLEFSNSTRTVDVHIRGLRKKIEIDPAQPSRIVTVWGSGYRFEG